jgi:predicted porin
VNFSGVNLVGYYYNGEGVGTTGILMDGFDRNGASRDSDGGYVQASFKIPGVGTKLAASWGESNLDANAVDNNTNLVKTNEMWTIGAYHPLTSSVNLVAEYSKVNSSNQAGKENSSDIFDVGAILFF